MTIQSLVNSPQQLSAVCIHRLSVFNRPHVTLALGLGAFPAYSLHYCVGSHHLMHFTLLLYRLLQIPPEQKLWNHLKVDNCSLNYIRLYKTGKVKVLHINETQHLSMQ